MADLICRRPGCDRRAKPGRTLCRPHYLATSTRVDAAPIRAELTEWRAARGMSLHTVARLTGLSPRTIRGVVTGDRRTVHKSTARAILGAIAEDRAGEFGYQRYGPLVPSFPTTRRLRSLRAAGVRESTISAATGIGRQTLSRLTWAPGRTVHASIDAAVASAFASLGALPVSCPPRGVAEQQWPMPVEWEDDAIVDPRGKPHAHGHTRAWRLREYNAGRWPAPISPATRLAAEYAARGELTPGYAATLAATAPRLGAA